MFRCFAPLGLSICAQHIVWVNCVKGYIGGILQEALKKRLRTKLKNERYRSQAEELEIQRASKKQKRASGDGHKRGMPHYLPTTSAPSIEVVNAMHSLKSGGGGATPGDADALKAMSFPERRRLIVSCRLPIGRLMDKCPWLFSEDEVSGSFGLTLHLCA